MPRKNSLVDSYTIGFIGNISRKGCYDPAIGVIRPVIEKYYELHFPNLVKELAMTSRKNTKAYKEQLALMRSMQPREWRYTHPRLRTLMMFYSRNDHCSRPMTLWLGQKLVREAVAEGKSVAPLLRKRLKDRLDYALGKGESQFWFHLESVPHDPWKLHAHGIIEFRTPEFFNRKTGIGGSLRDVIRDAAGEDIPIGGEAVHQLSIKGSDYNQNWLDYCVKQRRDRVNFRIHPEPPKEIGRTIAAGTREMQKRAEHVYSELRWLMRGMITGQIEAWTADEWERHSGFNFDLFPSLEARHCGSSNKVIDELRLEVAD